MNKKGFTLIELLAVIVVLSIILVISVPRVMNVVEEADKEAFRITGENLIKGAIDRSSILNMEDPQDRTYTIVDGAFVGDSIPMSGELPDEGVIHVTTDKKVSVALSNETWCAVKNEEDDNVLVNKDPECVLHIPETVPDTCFTRTNNGIEVTITDYDNSCSKDVIIPDTLDGLPVRIIGSATFYLKQLTSVSIPNSVTTISDLVFSENQLSTITIPNSVTSIGDWALDTNQFTTITIPSSVITIGQRAFAHNQIANLTIGNNVTSMGYGVFNDNLLPDETAFIYARKLDGSEDLTKLYSYAGAKRVGVIIPSNVTSIGWYAFSSLQLTSITIPNTVTNIEGGAFTNNQLTSITIPNSVTDIGGIAFSDNQLTSVTLSNSLLNIGNYAFRSNQLTNIVIPNSLTTIGNGVFAWNLLTSITIPANVTIINDSISSTFYTSYVTVNARAAGTYTAPSQSGTWTKQL